MDFPDRVGVKLGATDKCAWPWWGRRVSYRASGGGPFRVESCFRRFPTSIPMNELKNKLTALGLSDEMATRVIATVGDFAKSKLPEKFHGMLDDVLAGKSPDLGSLGGILGSLFGGR